MSALKYLIGHKFGKLLVLNRSATKNGKIYYFVYAIVETQKKY
jgi:hypothetical protein